TLTELQHFERAGPPAMLAAVPHGDDSLPVAQARRLICDAVAPVAEHETVALRAALDRVLAQDIISPINVPAYDNSAMDGYALRGSDLPADAGAPEGTPKVIGI